VDAEADPLGHLSGVRGLPLHLLLICKQFGFDLLLFLFYILIPFM